MRRDNGLALIETLFTSLIVITSVGAVTSVFIHSAHVRHRAYQQTRGIYLAYEKFEELREQDQLLLGRQSQELQPDGPASETFLQVWEVSEGIQRHVTVTLWAREPVQGGYRKVATITGLSGVAP